MPIPTEPIGSIPRTADLLAAMHAHAAGKISAEQLKRAEESALRDTIGCLEGTGSPVITDGEQTKPSFATYPLSGLHLVSDGVVIPYKPAPNRNSQRGLMNRRNFLQSTGALCAGWAVTQSIQAFADALQSGGGWRSFEVTTRVEVLKPSGVTHIWLPSALIRDTPFQRTHANKFSAEGGTAKFSKDKPNALGIVSATYPANARPVLTLTSNVSLKNYSVDLSVPGKAPHASKEELDYFLQPSRYVPTDGIVKETALKATAGANTEMEKARAIYDWVVDNTFRDPRVRGCGRGDVRFMLESGDLGGKCADLNALYVGLARSVGLPARHVYGLRIAKSDLGYKSLGLATDKATKGQHCRTEVYLRDHGWVPVDPADVRKVVLEEPPGNRPLSDEMVSKARKRLFGSWEMNWMAYNYAHDVVLPGSAKQPLVYFMYPQAETAEGRVDPFDPDNFKYEITVKEMS